MKVYWPKHCFYEMNSIVCAVFRITRVLEFLLFQESIFYPQKTSLTDIQMVWATTNRVGCAVQTCYNMVVWGAMWRQATYLVCNYSPKWVLLNTLTSSTYHSWMIDILSLTFQKHIVRPNENRFIGVHVNWCHYESIKAILCIITSIAAIML